MSHDEPHRNYRQKILDIEEMIAEENDPKQRSFLIILNSINNSLIANTETTLDLSAKFAVHLSKFEQKVESDAEMIHKGQGAWRVVAWVLGAAQAIVVAAAIRVASNMETLAQTDIRIEHRVTAVETSIAQKKP